MTKNVESQATTITGQASLVRDTDKGSLAIYDQENNSLLPISDSNK